MRGKALPSPQALRVWRITPAYAGKSQFCQTAGFCLIGSPPPMRGKVFTIKRPKRCPGITPAYAGKSRSECQNHSLLQDHPRLCGEKMQLDTDGFHTVGSPPPMRGKVVRTSVRITVYRITPAYAGKSKL